MKEIVLGNVFLDGAGNHMCLYRRLLFGVSCSLACHSLQCQSFAKKKKRNKLGLFHTQRAVMDVTEPFHKAGFFLVKVKKCNVMIHFIFTLNES